MANGDNCDRIASLFSSGTLTLSSGSLGTGNLAKLRYGARLNYIMTLRGIDGLANLITSSAAMNT
jgi:hypothetical protein